MKKPRPTLQAKYITLIAIIVTCTSMVLSAYYYYAVRAREIAELGSKGRSMTMNLAHNSEEGVLFSDTQHLSLLVKLLAEDSDVAAAEITSNDGIILAHIASDSRFLDPSNNSLAEVVREGTETPGVRAVQYRVSDSGIQLLEFSVPITTRRIARDREEIGLMFGSDAATGDRGEQLQIGTARVVLSSIRPFRELRRIQRNIIGITAMVALAGILITVPLVRITVKPIRRLADGTRKIAAGDLSERIAVTTHDEIRELADGFNQMAVDLEKKHAELKQHSQTLEERVRERTKELELANTDLRKAQAQLIQAGKMAAMGEFGAGVAHELNQPLTGIKGYAQLLLSMVPEDSPLRGRLLEIDKQASRMKEITQTMWNLARQSNFEYSFIEVSRPIKDSLILISEQFRQHQIEIVTEIDEDLPNVYGDANQLHQVFLNILTNARDAIDENKGGRVKIKVTPVADARYVQILMMDNGRGIPIDIMDNVFDPFFTTKAPGKGTGLGLSINYSIIEQHRGFINAHSKESKGTVFSVTLPTEVFTRCSKNNDEVDATPVAPCWVTQSGAPSGSHMRTPDCSTCEIYMQFQSPPEMSLAAEFEHFLAENSQPSSSSIRGMPTITRQ